MNKKHLKELVENASKIDPQNEVLIEENMQKRLNIMKENLQDTMDYLNNCSENELLWATEVLEELSEYFESNELITCIERNIIRCQSIEVKTQLETSIKYIKKYIQNKN